MGDIQKDSSKYTVLTLIDQTQTKIEKALVSIGLILVTSLLFINIMYSFVKGSTIPWASEISQYIMVWVVFIGASTLMRKAGHVTMDLIARFLSQKAILYLDMFIYTVVSIFLFYLAYIGLNMTLDVYRTGQTMINVSLSMAWVYLSFPVGVLLMAINALKIVVINSRKAVGGEIN
ncbi:MAG TPA: TRAP transporter small permease [Peptococcaceae bacterium]|nr:TRAP transporter small permease [Peptococcaceae bacterium]